MLIRLDMPHGTVSVLSPENYAKYLKSEFLSLNLKLGLFKHWLLQSESLSEISVPIKFNSVHVRVNGIPRGFQMAEEVPVTCE